MCGFVASSVAVEQHYTISTVRRQLQGPVDCQHDGESVTKCPKCGAVESFVPATICEECDCYPCECGADVVWLRKVTAGKAVRT